MVFCRAYLFSTAWYNEQWNQKLMPLNEGIMFEGERMLLGAVLVMFY